MQINLNHLYTFFLVVNSGSLSEASEKLFVTEPAVSMQVKSLEREVGQKLLERKGNELRPTELGEIVYAYCKKIFCTVFEMTRALDVYRDAKTGILKVGMAKSLLNYLMPLVLPPFMDRHPTMRIQFEEGSTLDLMDGLVSRNYELIVTAKIPHPRKIVDSVPFTTSRLFLVGSPRNPLSRKGRITIEELSKIPIILKDSRSATRYIVLNELERVGVKPRLCVESDNLDFIRKLVKEDKGFSFLSDLCIRDDVKRRELKIIEVEGLKLEYRIDIFFLKNRTLSACGKAFFDYLLSIRRDELLDILRELEGKSRTSRKGVSNLS